MRTVHLLALTLAVVGALNWGLVGVLQYDLVAHLFGGQDAAGSRVVYTLVGLAGLTLALTAAMLTAPGGRAGYADRTRPTM